MQPTLPVLRALLPLAAFCAISAPLAAQGGRVFPVQSTQSSDNQPSTTERLTAIVVSSVDGAPIPRAIVTSPDQRYAAFTDSQGRFAFDLRRAISTGAPAQSGAPAAAPFNPSAIFISFSVRKPGFIANNVSLPEPQNQPDTPAPPAVVKLIPTGTVTGQIYTDASDLPQSLTVQLLRRQITNGRATWFPANTAVPNSRGEFRVPNLDPGQYKLRIPAVIAHPDSDAEASGPASRTGFLPAYYPNTTSEDNATSLTVGPGESVTANLRLRTVPFYQVTVPLAGQSDKQSLNAPPGLTLRQNGQSFTGYLPDGNYDLLLYSAGQPTASMPQPQLSDATVKLEVNGHAVHTPPVALHPVPDIPIIVHREFTAGLPQPASAPNQPAVVVFLQNLRQDIPQPAPYMKPNTSEENLALTGATPGVYNVVVSPRMSNSAYIAAVTSGSTDLLRDPLQILADSDPRPIEITLRDDFASVTATVVSDTPQPPASPTSPTLLLCLPLDRPQAQPGFAVINQQNQATVQNLAPGRYLLLAGYGQQFFSVLEYTNEEVLRSAMQKGTLITLAPNDKATVQVSLFPEGSN